MQSSEIDNLCASVAAETGLPVEWVKHHVDQKAGRPCRRCDGSGTVAHGECYRCKGSGGRATPTGVAEALFWVRGNVERVRELGEKRKENEPHVEAERRRRVVLEVAQWKLDHSEVWALLDDMTPCDFKSSVVQAIELGRVSERQLESLEEMVKSKRKPREAPPVGTSVELQVAVTRHGFGFDGRGRRVFQIGFSVDGWSGRAEIEDEAQGASVQWFLRGRVEGPLFLSGTVVWQRGGFAILGRKIEVR